MLDSLHEEDPSLFHRVFRTGDRLADRPGRRLLQKARLLDWRGRPRVVLIPFHGHLIAADRDEYRELDQVFAIMFEQHYLTRNTSLREGDDVLELCSGSGVNCIWAAELARSVTGVEVSSRALAFAEFNRVLNAGAERIRFMPGSLFEPLENDRTFDLILINPPFECAPGFVKYYLHSDGGEDGLDVTRACLKEASRHLAEGGRFEIILQCVGGDDGPLVLELLADSFPSHDIECHLLHIDPIETQLCRDEDQLSMRDRWGVPQEQLEEWRRGFAERGLTCYYFVFCRVTPGPAGVRVLTPYEEIAECRRLVGPSVTP